MYWIRWKQLNQRIGCWYGIRFTDLESEQVNELWVHLADGYVEIYIKRKASTWDKIVVVMKKWENNNE